MTKRTHSGAFPILHTPRLILRTVGPVDAGATSELMTPEVSRRLYSWTQPFTQARAAERIARAMQAMREGLEAHYGIERRSDGKLLGWISLHRETPESAEVGLGIWLGEAFQGHGYGREAVDALIPIGFGLLGFDHLVASVQVDNLASIHLLEAAGMHRGETRILSPEGWDSGELCVLFNLHASDLAKAD